jgi:hypothetical protein
MILEKVLFRTIATKRAETKGRKIATVKSIPIIYLPKKLSKREG